MIKTIEKLKPKPLLVITTKNTTLTSSEKQEKFKKKKKVLPKLQALILNSKLRFATESPRSFFTTLILNSKNKFQTRGSFKKFEKQTKLKVKLEKEEIVPRKNGEKSESGGGGETEDAEEGVFGRL